MSKEAVRDLADGRRILSSGNPDGRPEQRLAVLGSFTLDHLPPMLAAAFARLGLHLVPRLADFNQWRQEILDPGSGLYAFKPDAVVLYAALEDLFPDFYAGPALSNGEQSRRVTAELASLESLAGRLLSSLPGATLYLVVPPLAAPPAPFVAGSGEPFRGQAGLEAFLAGLRRLPVKPGGSGRIVAVDLDFHARGRGSLRLNDDRLWYTARMRLGLEGTKALSDLIAYYFELAVLPRAKVVAVDLDNTLWGGIAGEDGWENLELGTEGIGLAFQDFQRELLRLKAAGLLLAVCSKNDEAAAWEVFEKNRGMVLKRSDFAAFRINWLDKSENLRSIAKELSLGVDSFVFLDDDPIQRAGVAAQLPATVPELPADPTLRPRFLRELRPLHRLSLTAEDAGRAKQYEERGQREALRSSSGSLLEFLAGLKQEALIEPLSEATLQRAAQLCGKTNQFNLTTRRYGSAELSAMMKEPSVRAYTLTLTDAFGDNGIVGFAVLRLAGAEAEIDTLLMSCRVLGRLVEDAFAASLVEIAWEAGCRVILGRHIPTPKNGQAKDFYPKLGFEPAGEEGLYRLASPKTPPRPDGVQITTSAKSPSAPGGSPP
ncbi:MAG: HAD-IIIC family phosphatase [Elusimicrobiota bacterium]|jgi:FkbH-like protein